VPARETAAIALAGRRVPLEVLIDLHDIGFGSFEGRTLAAYRTWVAANAPGEAAPRGETRAPERLDAWCEAPS
jgi:broad specificity phosphatase PhoE